MSPFGMEKIFSKNKIEQENLFDKDEVVVLVKFLGNSGLRELKNFIQSNEDTILMNSYNPKKIHLLNEIEYTLLEEDADLNEIDSPKTKEDIVITANFIKIMRKHNLDVLYYDSGMGSHEILTITKNTKALS
ncbi:hypothetical protein HC864_00190 [Candidatus Gracilibacteria bacterium]|nr:hypothetical protein [Candidatus Gracilibacteria bacterium]